MSVLSRTMLLIAGSCIAAATPVLAQSQADEQRFQQAQQRLDNELNVFRSEFDRYQQARARGYRDPRGGSYYDPRVSDQRYSYDDRDESGYDPSRYYRDGSSYQERVLTSSDRVYRGTDGRYYCKRNDGTTGLIVGAIGGGVLGNVIAGGHSAGVGTLLGAIAGGVLGKSIDQNNQQMRCR
ncbi:hypothetical protein GCM10011395_05560 [Sphingomonas psychrolutea]|uniref:17 kDa surface antigen n=2 Tax=Sphingomonas psychrolutea TaxID=1259676 RepID=A0ABQ1G7B9_9SPHN|nr:hypothetical protein GCM10011395_05560 [Sphingomonas psychrolutea]